MLLVALYKCYIPLPSPIISFSVTYINHLFYISASCTFINEQVVFFDNLLGQKINERYFYLIPYRYDLCVVNIVRVTPYKI